jgi:hypothetical protein
MGPKYGANLNVPQVVCRHALCTSSAIIRMNLSRSLNHRVPLLIKFSTLYLRKLISTL